MPHARSRFGSSGEEFAARYLEAHGFRLVDRNARTPVGELDLVCERGNEVVFVEVKTRASSAFGYPEESVTRTKQQHLVRAAHAYMAAHRSLLGRRFRIDVVAITIGRGVAPEIIHIPYAVERS